MQRRVRFGILGWARIARRELIPAMLAAQNAVPYALASGKPGSREEAAKAFPFGAIYADYRDLLDDPQVEAVYIPLPNGLHREWTLRAARAGKHVLCEKPLALTREDCEEMAAVCRENGVKLMEAFMYRFTARTAKLKAVLASGVIGEVRHVSSTFRFFHDRGREDVRFDPALGGGSLWDVGCYPVNLIGLVMGEEPEEVRALKTVRYGVDYSLSAVLRYHSGALCTLNAGFDSASAQVTEINGTLGSLLLRDSFDGTDAPILLTRGGKTEEIPVPASQRYVLEIEDFADAVLTGREPGFSLAETIRNVGLIQRIYRAAESGGA